MASSSPASVDAKTPLLASASGTGAGAPHALWRPQMQTFLMRHGIEERDYAREIAQWRALAAAVEAKAEADEQDAIAVVLGAAMSSASSKPKEQTPEEAKAKQRVADLISRSRKAFGFLYAALPVDLRPLVADVPQGYAFGIWSFLEKRFRSTEQDSVMALWERLTTMQQDSADTHDVYKARVDSVVELLKHAQQTVPAGLYASLLLWRLQPRYNTAVLTLKTGERLKDPAAIDWPYVANYMAQYERSQLGLGDTVSDSPGAGDRAMAARSRPPPAAPSAGKKPSATGRDHSDVECFNCHKFGHYASRCPLPDRRQKGDQEGRPHQKPHQQQQHDKRGAPPSRKPAAGFVSRNASDDDDGGNSSSEGKTSPRLSSGAGSSRVNAARQLNRFALLSGSEDDGERWLPANSMNRSYCARVLAGMKSVPAPPSPAAPRLSNEKKTVRFGPPTEASARERERRSPEVAKRRAPGQSSKSLDVALRTTAQAIDSGATVSITGNKDILVNVRRCQPMPILMADKAIVSAVYQGDMPMRLPVADKPDSYVMITIRDVYYHERIDANLLSWGCMRLDGWQMHSTKEGTYVVTPKGTRINASTRGRLTILDNAGTQRAYAARMGRFVCRNAEDLLLLHQRTGHASWTRMLKMCRAGATTGVGDISGLSSAELKKAESLVRQCDACAAGKQKRNSLGHHGLDKGSEAGEVLHMDVFYTTLRNPQTNEKYHEYCLLGTDGYTELRWITHTNSLHDVQAAVIQMIRDSTTACGRTPRLIVSDLGSEFENNKVKAYCRERGIHLQPSPARAKELNGVAEKSVDTVKNHTRAMLIASGMPQQKWWSRAAAHHVFLWNRTHIGASTGVTPYEATLCREPSIVNVGVFGCDAFVHMDRTQRDTTFSPKAEPGIYLGHDSVQNCPTVYMLRTGKTLKVKDVLFREESFKHLQALLGSHPDQVAALDLSELDADEEQELKSGERKPTTTEQEDTDHLQVDDESDDDGEEEEEQSKHFVVKAITAQSNIDGKEMYRVKWVGYSASTWEPVTIIREDAPDAVKEYEAFLAQRSEARVTRSRSGTAASSVTAASSSSSSSAAPSSSRPQPTALPVRRSDSDDESEQSAISAARLCAAKCL
jgi:hypothetical protein